MSRYSLYNASVVACLRAAIWNEPSPIDLSLLREKDFWLCAYRQDCGHLLTVWALSHGYDLYDKERMRVLVYTRLQRQVRQNRWLVELVNLFRSNDIPVVLLKGYGLCSYYPDPSMRDYDDIDLYVGSAQYPKAYSLIAQTYPNAFWLSPVGAGHHFILVLDEQHELVAEIHNLSMDFFGQPKLERIFGEYTDDAFAHADSITLYETSISVPPLSYNVVYLFVHLWHHFLSSGVGLRQLNDWVLCIHALSEQLSPAEWKIFEQQTRSLLQSMHLLSVWQSFGYVAVHYLGLTSTSFPLYSSKFSINTSSRILSLGSSYRIWQSKRLYRQLLADGHCGRPSAIRSEQIMHPFPENNFSFLKTCNGKKLSKSRTTPEGTSNRSTRFSRFAHRLYSFLCLTYNSIQLAKLFPSYSFYLYFTQLRTILRRSSIPIAPEKITKTHTFIW